MRPFVSRPLGGWRGAKAARRRRFLLVFASVFAASARGPCEWLQPLGVGPVDSRPLGPTTRHTRSASAQGGRKKRRSLRVAEATRNDHAPKGRRPSLHPRSVFRHPCRASLPPRSTPLQPRSAILRPRSASLRPRSASRQPRSALLRPRSASLQPRRMILSRPRTCFFRVRTAFWAQYPRLCEFLRSRTQVALPRRRSCL